MPFLTEFFLFIYSYKGRKISCPFIPFLVTFFRFGKKKKILIFAFKKKIKQTKDMTAYTTQYPRTRKARRQPRITRRKTAYTTQYPRTRKARCQPRITRMKGQLQAKTIGTKKPKPIPDDFKFFVYHPTTTPSAADQKPCQTTQSSRKPKSPKLSHINAPSLISKIHAS